MIVPHFLSGQAPLTMAASILGPMPFLSIAAFLFVIGCLGIFINRRNLIIILMCIEMMLLAININFVTFSTFTGHLGGQVFSLIVLAIAAAEAAIGLALLVAMFRLLGSILLDPQARLKGDD